MRGTGRLAPLLSTLGLAWCVLAGGRLWFTTSLAGVSRYGAAPLLVPVAIATVAAWSAWRGHRLALGVAALLLAGFTDVAGFSIGGAYVPAAALLLIAAGANAVIGRR